MTRKTVGEAGELGKRLKASVGPGESSVGLPW